MQRLSVQKHMLKQVLRFTIHYSINQCEKYNSHLDVCSASIIMEELILIYIRVVQLKQRKKRGIETLNWTSLRLRQESF